MTDTSTLVSYVNDVRKAIDSIHEQITDPEEDSPTTQNLYDELRYVVAEVEVVGKHIDELNSRINDLDNDVENLHVDKKDLDDQLSAALSEIEDLAQQ